PLLIGAAVVLFITGGIFAGKGADFVPRIDEGDMVVSLRRPPSINLTEAKRLDLEVQKVLLGFPEVDATLAFTGRAEVAIDPAGKDKTDIVDPLKPKEEWVTAHDLDALSVVFKDAIES